MDKFIERLNRIISEVSNGNVTEFAKKAGIKQATLFNYTKGRMPNAESLYNICNNIGVSIDWLLTGKGSIHFGKQGDPHRGQYTKVSDTPKLSDDRKVKSRDLDSDLLKTIIVAVEEGLEARDLELAAPKKAELITLLYELYSESNKQIDKQTVGRYLRLVA